MTTHIVHAGMNADAEFWDVSQSFFCLLEFYLSGQKNIVVKL